MPGDPAVSALTVREADALGTSSDAWDRLVDLADLPTPFLRSWWLGNVAEHRPRFVMVADGDELVGGMALEEDQVLGVPRYRVLGHHRFSPDHLDVLAEPDRRDEVLAALRAWCARPGARIFDLKGLRRDSGFADILPGPLRAERVGDSPYRSLPAGEPEALLGSLSRNLRKSLRRDRKKVAAAGVAYRLVPPEEVEGALERLRELHDRQWGEESRFLAVFDRFAAAVRAASPSEVVFHELHRDGDVLASEVCFHDNGRVSSFQSGRDLDSDLRSLGKVLTSFAIEHACAVGATEYDLLRGEQSYKQMWATHSREVWRLEAVRGPTATAAQIVVAGRVRAGELKGRIRRRLRTSGERAPNGERHTLAGRSDAQAVRLAARAPGRAIATTGERAVLLLDDPEQLHRHSRAWDDLPADPVGSPAAHRAWVAATGRHLPRGSRLAVVMVLEHGEPTAIAPLMRTDGILRRLRLMGPTPGGFRYRDEAALRRLVEAIAGLGLPLRLESLIADSVPDRLLRSTDSRCLVRTTDHLGGGSLALDASYAQPLDKVNSRRRNDLRRKFRRAEELGRVRFEVHRPSDEAELRHWFEEYVRLEGLGWKAEAGTDLGSDHRLRETMWSYLRADDVLPTVRIPVLTIDDQIVAMEIAYLSGGRYWFDKFSFDPTYGKLSPGQLLMIRSIGWAAEEGLERYEFCGGLDRYKAVWADGQPLRMIRSYPANPAGAITFGADAVRTVGRRLERGFDQGLERVRARRRPT